MNNMISIFKKKNFAPHQNHTDGMSKSAEFAITTLIVLALAGSLTSHRYVDLPSYVVPILIIGFIALKIAHIIRQGGTLLEDYATIAALLVFLILDIALKDKLNSFLVTVFIVILLYSTGLMFWVRSKFSSKKITHFIASYLTAIVMVIFLFAGAFLSNPDKFIVQGVKGTIGLEDAFYFSSVTFTTVGYGDITPLGVNRFFSIIESLIGMTINVALLGYVLSSGKINDE